MEAGGHLIVDIISPNECGAESIAKREKPKRKTDIQQSFMSSLTIVLIIYAINDGKMMIKKPMIHTLK